MNGFRSSAAVIVTALFGVLLHNPSATAATRFDCVLTDIGTQPGSESRPITVVFDDDAKSLSAQAGTRSFRFAGASITNVAISAATDDVSIGIDRSSLGIVWQEYGSTGVTIEYGKCRQNGQPAASTY